MDAQKYNDKIMNGAFKKIYPEIARQIIDRTQITDGLCLDLGGGPGMLGVWLAKLTNLKVIVYDLMSECVGLVEANALLNDVSEKVTARQGRAEQLNFSDNSVDLIASRGSIFFWEDQEKAISEIYRVLKPGGWAYVGGGFGTKELLNEVMDLRANDKDWTERRKKRVGKNSVVKFREILKKLQIDGTVESSDVGNWIIFRK